MANCSSGLLGVIVRNTFHFIPVVPLLALKIKKDLSEIAGWVCPTKKDMGDLPEGSELADRKGEKSDLKLVVKKKGNQSESRKKMEIVNQSPLKGIIERVFLSKRHFPIEEIEFCFLMRLPLQKYGFVARNLVGLSFLNLESPGNALLEQSLRPYRKGSSLFLDLDSRESP